MTKSSHHGTDRTGSDALSPPFVSVTVRFTCSLGYNSVMARPLWRDLRTAREQRSLAALPTVARVPLPPRPRWKLAVFSTLVAVAAIVLNERYGSLARYASLHQQVWAWSTSAAFLVFGSIAARRVANQLARLVHIGAGATAGNALRLIATIVGLIITILVTIGMLGVSAEKILTAAGITGVILGLAAQQSLGNVFAGLVLMIARPFVIGQRIRVRSGSYGGIFDGEVRAMGLTYVELLTDDGDLKVPNLGMLAAAVGPAPSASAGTGDKSLYVDRSVPKRPPRSTSHAPQRRSARRRVREARVVRVPRDIIRQMRVRPQDEKGGEPGPARETGEAGGREQPEDPCGRSSS